MRKPTLSPPNVESRSDNRLVTETRHYKVITPLFGGGVRPGEADPVTVVRATEIRGHLRFWWRALNAGNFNNVEALKRRENEIWGSTDNQSSINVYLPKALIDQGIEEVAFRMGSGKKRPDSSPKIAPYAAFPLLPDKEEEKQANWQSERVRLNVSFGLRVSYPEKFATDVHSSLWAWETFGGIGARTRRGFGALQQISMDSNPPTAQQIERRIRERLSLYCVKQAEMTDVPLLTPQLRFKFTPTFNDPIDAWKYLISKLNQFRQARYKNKFGLSKWPEANEIRRLYGAKAKLPDDKSSTALIRSFPRSAFGLPIIFHMPHDRTVSDGITLEGAPNNQLGRNYDRLASPLILRPLACAGGKFVGLAAILVAPTIPPNGLVLKGAPGNPAVRADLTSAEAKQIDPLNGNTDVLQAFLDWL
jgi:CRISPR-associated protein Cmr1